jgi:hypothetical protein
MLRRHTFLICFVVTFLLLFGINLVSYLVALQCCDGDSYMNAGFPLAWYTTGGFVALPHVLWNGLVADLIIAIGASYVTTKILRSVFAT